MEIIKYVLLISFLIFCFQLFWFREWIHFLVPKHVSSTTTKTNKTSIKIIAFWVGRKSQARVQIEQRNIQRECSHLCTLHADLHNPLDYDAIVFHGLDWQPPPTQRNPNQVYIMYIMETPAFHQSEYVRGDKFYNWTITFSRRSDVFFPYFEVLQTHVVQPEFTLPQMVRKRSPHQAMVAWIVSHCHTASKREKYVDVLRRSIAIDIYGRCGNSCNHNGTSCIKTLARTGQYKFYLAFENSACKGYITEKSLLPMKSGLVPVVYGGRSSEDYVRMLPPHSFIDVRKFKSPRQLAQYLIYLDCNHTAYRAYFAWRKSYITTHGNMCRLCRALHSNSMARPRNVNWGKFWNSSTMCDAKVINKVLH